MKFPLFRIDETEFSKQVAEHDTMPVWRSSRGIAVQTMLALLALGVAIIGAFAYFEYASGLTPVDMFLSLAMYAPLLYFTYRGHLWAMILLALLYSIDKIVTPLMLGLAPNISSLVFWALGVGPLWVAIQVERAYRKARVPVTK